MKRFKLLSLALRFFLLFSFMLRVCGSEVGFIDPLHYTSDNRPTQYSNSLFASEYLCHASGLMEKVRNALSTTPHFNKTTPPKSISAGQCIDRQIESSYSQYALFSASSIDCLEGPAVVFPFHCFT